MSKKLPKELALFTLLGSLIGLIMVFGGGVYAFIPPIAGVLLGIIFSRVKGKKLLDTQEDTVKSSGLLKFSVFVVFVVAAWVFAVAVSYLLA